MATDEQDQGPPHNHGAVDILAYDQNPGVASWRKRFEDRGVLREVSDSDDEDLASRWDRLKEGPGADTFSLPTGIEVLEEPARLVLRGPAVAVAALRAEFFKLARSGEGAHVNVGAWGLRVAEAPDLPHGEREIVMPWHGWQMAGIILADAAYGYEPNPSYFSEVGYIVIIGEQGEVTPAPRPDIGVAVTGDLLGR